MLCHPPSLTKITIRIPNVTYGTEPKQSWKVIPQIHIFVAHFSPTQKEISGYVLNIAETQDSTDKN